MNINIIAIHITADIPNCITAQEIQQAEDKDDPLHQLRAHIIRGWPESINEVPQ